MIGGAARAHQVTAGSPSAETTVAELDHLSRTTDMREVFSSFKGAAFAGEPLGARARAQLESWGVEIYLWTSTGDVTGAWDSMRAGDRS